MPHQIEVLTDPTRFKVLIWHRRARKTTTAINELLKQACLIKGVYWHIFPTFTEAKNAIWIDPNMLFSVIPEQIIASKNQAELSITLRNGSIIKLMGADNPDRFRGAGPLGVVLDEYDTMKNDVWPILQPILRQNGGWAWFIGTPKGQQKLYNLYNLGKSGNPEWKSWLLKASTSGIIDSENLANSKATMPEALYNQEFECDFLEGEGKVFRNVRDIMDAQPRRPIPGHLYSMGVDLAKYQDYTVITVYDRENNSQVYQDRFNKLEWPFQKEKIKTISNYYNKALVRIDATGLGDPIADDLIRMGVPVEPVQLTNLSKKELIEKTSLFIQTHQVHMIYIEDTLTEFDNFGYELSQNGNVRYNAPDGFHDDIVIAHALAISGLYQLLKKENEPEKTGIQQYFESITKPQDYSDYEEVNE